MTDQLTISIPLDLARYAVWQRRLVHKYETNQLIRALDTWLVLKSCSRPSLIQNWNKQKQDLFALCKCSESIFRHRLKVLRDLQLIKFDRNDIRLASWNQVEKILNIDVEKKLTIQYSIHDNTKIYQWLIAAEIKDNQNRQAYKIFQKMEKNPELKMILTAAVIAAGADRNQVKDPGYFLSWLNILYVQDFQRASEIHDELIEIRPDTNRSVKGMADAWKAKHAMTVSYWKKSLHSAGIIDIAKLQIKSQCRARNKHCKVLWIKKDLQTLLCLCDQITILQPWLIQNLQAA